jgi:hypothetical protein
MTWKAWIASPDLVTRHELGAELLTFNGAARHLAAGEWQAEVVPAVWSMIDPWMPTTPDMAPPVFAVTDVGRVLMSGPVRTASLERSGPDTTAKLSGPDDYGAVLSSRLIWPQPADEPPWTTSAYHVVIGQASAVVCELVRRHRGDLARPERRGTGLSVTDLGGGMTGTWQYRLSRLIDAVAQIGREAGLTVSVTRNLVTGLIDVAVGGTRDRTNLVLDDSKLGDSTLSRSSAEATTIVAGGGGEGTSRLFAIAGQTAAGDARIEAFSDQRGIASQPSLQRSADAVRAAGSASSSFGGALTPAAAAQYQWHTHYELGDLMTLRVSTSAWPVTVEAVILAWDADGQRMTPVLGATPRHALEQLLRDVNGLADRLNDLEVI